MMPQVAPVNLELAMVVHMNQLMDEGVFHMTLAKESALAQEDCSCLWAEPSGTRKVAWRAHDIRRGDVAAGEFEVLEHEDNCRTLYEELTHESRSKGSVTH